MKSLRFNVLIFPGLNGLKAIHGRCLLLAACQTWHVKMPWALQYIKQHGRCLLLAACQTWRVKMHWALQYTKQLCWHLNKSPSHPRMPAPLAALLQELCISNVILVILLRGPETNWVHKQYLQWWCSKLIFSSQWQLTTCTHVCVCVCVCDIYRVIHKSVKHVRKLADGTVEWRQ